MTIKQSEELESPAPNVEYLTGWRFGAVGTAIVLSMFLVCLVLTSPATQYCCNIHDG